MRAGASLCPRLASVATDESMTCFASASRAAVCAGAGAVVAVATAGSNATASSVALLVAQLRDHDLCLTRVVDAALELHDGSERKQSEHPDPGEEHGWRAILRDLADTVGTTTGEAQARAVDGSSIGSSHAVLLRQQPLFGPTGAEEWHGSHRRIPVVP